jgi:hypothetical protein
MKKTTLLLVMIFGAFFVSTSTASAQETVRGTNYLNLGIGVGTIGLFSSGGVPIIVSFEHGITDDIGVGVILGYLSTSYDYTYTLFGVRGSYHLNELLNVQSSKVDLYGGASIYYRHYKIKNYDTSAGTVRPGLHVGGRYMFSNNLGAFAELGYSISALQLGVSLKF